MAQEPVGRVRVERAGDTAFAVIDNPPVNASSFEVREGLLGAVRALADDASVKAIVLIGAGKTFIAGADIREFGRMASGETPPPDLAAIILRIEDCPKPVIMGSVLSGAGISMLPIAMPVEPIAMPSGASLPTALARSLRDTPIRLRMSCPIAFMV